jgi:hypothetical protein
LGLSVFWLVSCILYGLAVFENKPSHVEKPIVARQKSHQNSDIGASRLAKPIRKVSDIEPIPVSVPVGHDYRARVSFSRFY